MIRSPLGSRRLLLLTGTAVIALFANGAHAQLKGGTVKYGQASISAPTATSTIIQQSTEKAVINWQSFSIPAGSSVTFQQPNSAAIALNRVTGPSPSAIFGSLTANGQIWLINPNGILFGHGSEINVGGLLATTSDLRDQDFLAGNYNFGIGSSNPNAAVVNRGSITAADGGSVVLAGARVDNRGLIEANLGNVVLGAAKNFTVDFQGDGLLSFQITAPVTQQPMQRNGEPASALVANEGTISAVGGKVLMTARAARNVLDNVINNTGIVEATSAASVNGEIVLDAGPTGTAEAGGILDASGKGAGQTGGQIEVLGDQVEVAAGAKLDVSGDAGGGTLLIGGNFHGAGPQQNATTTSVAQGAQLDANAITSGTGGKIAVWSNGTTSVAGTITATGGAKAGDGGTIETSGTMLSVAASATVDAAAPYGTPGTWLLDPANIVVASGGSANLTGGMLSLGQDPGLTDTIDPATIESALASNNVTLQASQDITVNDGIGYSSAFTLGLMSEGTIHINAPIQNGGTGAVDIIAGWDGTTSLAGVLGSSLNSGTFGRSGGDVTIASPVANKVAPGNKIAVGSEQGTTTVDAEDLTVMAINIDTALGDDSPGAVGAINVGLTGNLLVRGSDTGSNSGAQIGNGLPTDAQGNIAGNITLNVAGTVTLQGGSGPDGYAEIGNLGSDGNLTSNLSVTGAIDITAAQVTLAAGSGTDSFAQIGNGRFLGSASTTGASVTAAYSGDISVAATQSVSLQGNAAGAYAQIGNGGEVNALAAIGSGVTEEGNVTVSAGGGGSSGAVTLQAGGAANSYAQIGNGGSFVNAGTPQAGVAESGTILVSASGASGTASLTGSGSVATAYAQIGNGDAGGQNAGTVSGDVTLLASQVTEGSNALIGNASTNGSVSGGVTVAAPVDITGTVYSDLGFTVLPDETVGLLIDGTSEGTVTAGANGAYDFSLAGNLISGSGVDLLVYLLGGSAKGNSFYDDATGSVSGLDIYANYLRVVSPQPTVSAMAAGLATALGSNSGANFLFTIGSGNALNLASGTNLQINATGASLVIDQALNTGSAAFVLNTTGAVTQTQPITAGGLDLLGTGGSYTLTNTANQVATVAANTGTVDLTNDGNLAVGSVAGTSGVTGAGAVTLVASGNLTLDAGVLGSVVTLADGGTFANDAGSGAVATTGGRWLIYSQNPADDTDGGLVYNFRQYDAAYPTAPTPTSGNGFLYTLSPVVTAALTGTVTKVYDGTDAATLTGANYTLSGAASGDTVTLNEPASGTYASPDAGSGIAVSVSGLAITGVTNGAATVYGYQLASTAASGNIGTITAAPLTAGLTGTASKVYDGTTVATLIPANYTLSGIVNGDTVTLNDPTSGTYASPHAGTGIDVTVGGLAVSSPNYQLVSSSVTAPIGTITAAPLTVGLTGTVAKVYDGTTSASLVPANYTVSGIVSGTSVMLNDPTGGTYASPNVGTGIGVNVTGLAIASAGGGALTTDYALTSTSASANIGAIGTASLTVGLTGVVSKTYDGTTVATVVPGNYTLSGLMNGDSVTLNDPALGIYASPHAGTGIDVTVNGLALSSSNYILSSTSVTAPIGTITPAPVTAGLTGIVAKVYDGTTAATLTPANYTISGLVSGTTLTLNNPTSGAYASPNVGTGIGVNVSGLAIASAGGGAVPGDYALTSTSAAGNIGTIGTASLTVGLTGIVSKTYDGTTIATLNPANYTLSGVVSGDSVTLNDPTVGTYASANAGSGIGVSVSGLALSSSNYILASTTASANIGTITPAPVTVGLTGTVAKIYDGTTAATLTPANYALSGVLNGDVVALNNPTSGIYGSANVGAGIAVGVSGLTISAGNYALTSSSAAGNVGIITPATLTYVANPATTVQGSALPSLSGMITGFVTGQNLMSATTGTLAFVTPASPASAAGLYAIDGTGLVANNGNYSFVQAAQNATALSISAAPPPPPPPPPTTPVLTAGEQGAIVSLLQSNGGTPSSGGAGSAGAGEAAAGSGASTAGGIGPGALETLANGGPGHAATPEQSVTDVVTLALTKFSALSGTNRTIIGGILTESLPNADNSPHGVPPADQDFSSWGNEAFWQ